MESSEYTTGNDVIGFTPTQRPVTIVLPRRCAVKRDESMAITKETKK